jgi:hypothetical protein
VAQSPLPVLPLDPPVLPAVLLVGGSMQAQAVWSQSWPWFSQPSRLQSQPLVVLPELPLLLLDALVLLALVPVEEDALELECEPEVEPELALVDPVLALVEPVVEDTEALVEPVLAPVVPWVLVEVAGSPEQADSTARTIEARRIRMAAPERMLLYDDLDPASTQRPESHH